MLSGRILCKGFDTNCTCAATSGTGIYRNCCDNGDTTMGVSGRRRLPAPTPQHRANHQLSLRPPIVESCSDLMLSAVGGAKQRCRREISCFIASCKTVGRFQRSACPHFVAVVARAFIATRTALASSIGLVFSQPRGSLDCADSRQSQTGVHRGTTRPKHQSVWRIQTKATQT